MEKRNAPKSVTDVRLVARNRIIKLQIISMYTVLAVIQEVMTNEVIGSGEMRNGVMHVRADAIRGLWF